MKFTDVLTLSVAFASAASARPMRRTDGVVITFIGAADGQFSQSFPLDGSEVSIANPLSISHISSSTSDIQCTFHGVDNSVTSVSGVASVDVGPPQTQVSGTCSKLGGSSDTPPVTPPANPEVDPVVTSPVNSPDTTPVTPQVDPAVTSPVIPQVDPATAQVAVSFIGAADAKFGQNFPLDGSAVQIANPLSISHIEIDASGVSCTFKGIDQSVTTVTGPATVDVGPPQTQIEGTCSAA